MKSEARSLLLTTSLVHFFHRYFSIPQDGKVSLRVIMASYFTYLAVGLIPKNGEKSTGVVWAEQYEDGQGVGQVQAACAPIYDRRCENT